MYSKTLTLSNGVVVPQLALGTWFIDDALAAEAVRQAVKIGYRHVDTAQAYANERGVGEGVRTAGIPREELFVTTKVAAEHKDYESAARSIDESLAAMGLDYLDMMIIHSPQPWVEVNQSDDRHYEGNLEAWRALTDAYKAGKIRAIGVSLAQRKSNLMGDAGCVSCIPFLMDSCIFGFLEGESSEQVQRLVVVDLPGALPLETLAWSPVE
jgi:diketogulonate reductase-like aldo/keto reductase